MAGRVEEYHADVDMAEDEEDARRIKKAIKAAEKRHEKSRSREKPFRYGVSRRTAAGGPMSVSAPISNTAVAYPSLVDIHRLEDRISVLLALVHSTRSFCHLSTGGRRHPQVAALPAGISALLQPAAKKCPCLEEVDSRSLKAPVSVIRVIDKTLTHESLLCEENVEGCVLNNERLEDFAVNENNSGSVPCLRGRLRECLSFWRKIGYSSFVESVICDGYRLPFVSELANCLLKSIRVLSIRRFCV